MQDSDSTLRKYAEALKVSADYLLGDDEAGAVSSMFWAQKKETPFYKIFIEVTADKMGLDIPGVIQKTGLTDKQVRTIITRQMKVAPLDLAMQLSDTLNVPLEVWWVLRTMHLPKFLQMPMKLPEPTTRPISNPRIWSEWRWIWILQRRKLCERCCLCPFFQS